MKFDFSAHASHSELVKLAKATRAKTVVLMHGDQREALRDELAQFCDVETPENGRLFSV
jgi:putative mRNA 3-end processing factor